MQSLYNKHLSALKSTGKYRTLPERHKNPSEALIDFSTNDYLNLSQSPEVVAAALSAAQRYGVGATGSRLLSGHREIFEILEHQIAIDKGAEAALVFNSGFQTNLSVLSCLLDTKVLRAKPLVFFDKLNHASLYQAVFLAGAQMMRYRHHDMEHLEALLAQHTTSTAPKFIVSETLFGMEGDVVPLQSMVSLAQKHDAFLYLDEAHATGVLGHHGYGISTTVNLGSIPHMIMGTFSKALGCSGGYIACNNLLKEYVINKATGFIYSTANPPMMIGAASQAWSMVRQHDDARLRLCLLAKVLRERLTHLGFDIGTSSTHIIPVILGGESQATQAKEKLLQQGILVSCIRPPTVPPGTSRIRIALNTLHTEYDVERMLKALKNL